MLSDMKIYINYCKDIELHRIHSVVVVIDGITNTSVYSLSSNVVVIFAKIRNQCWEEFGDITERAGSGVWLQQKSVDISEGSLFQQPRL